jgi:hypothetical protein
MQFIGAPPGGSHLDVKRALLGIMVFTLALLVAGGGLSAASFSQAADGVSIPVHRCQTSFAVPSPPSRTVIPASLTASIPKRISKEVDFYTDSSRTMSVLGPAGWTCNATFAADGSGGLIVHPPCAPSLNLAICNH